MEPDKYLISIKPDGTITKTKLEGQPTLQQLQEIVGGHIELVPYLTKYEEKPCLAFCNTDGKGHGLPFNPSAHKVWETAYGRTIVEDYLVGAIAIVVGPVEFLRDM